MPYDVTALQKSIAVLEVLAATDEALGASEVARRARVSKNMAFRILLTLAEAGWIRQDGEQPRYRLSLRPFHLFSRPMERAQLSTSCQEPLRRLGAASGQTAYLAVLDGVRAVNVQVIEGGGSIRVAGAVGSAFPLHCTAQGKVFLAHDAALLKRLPARLERFTPSTCTSKKLLATELAAVRDLGWAINDEEYGRGLIGCAAPIRDRENRLVAAIGVFVPAIGHDRSSVETQLLPLVLAAAREGSEALGHQAQPDGRSFRDPTRNHKSP